MYIYGSQTYPGLSAAF